MQPAPPAALQLAQRLRQLRQRWPEARLTQDKLAVAFSAEENLAAATVSSWESLKSPKLPPRHRLQAYARFFATPRSVEEEPTLFPLDELTPDEKRAYEKLETELLRLRRCGQRGITRRRADVQPIVAFPRRRSGNFYLRTAPE